MILAGPIHEASLFLRLLPIRAILRWSPILEPICTVPPGAYSRKQKTRFSRHYKKKTIIAKNNKLRLKSLVVVDSGR